MSGIELSGARRFLALGRIAVVGVSRDPRDFSRAVLAELARRGLDVVAVSPHLDPGVAVEGRPAARRLADVHPPPDGALLLTPPAATDAAVRDCVALGIRHVWMHRGGGPGAATPTAVALCRDAGVALVTDLCPFMALEGVSLPHRLHRALRVRFGRATAGAPRT